MYQSNTKTGILKYFNTLNNDTLVGTYTFITNIVYNTMFITGSPLYYALGYGPTIQIYYVSNNTNICNITLPTNIFDVRISDNWVYVSSISFIRQYKVKTCMQFAQSVTTVGYYLQYHLARTGVDQRLFAWTNTSGTFKVNNVKDRYTCVGGCSACMSEYGLDGVTN